MYVRRYNKYLRKINTKIPTFLVFVKPQDPKIIDLKFSEDLITCFHNEIFLNINTTDCVSYYHRPNAESYQYLHLLLVETQVKPISVTGLSQRAFSVHLLIVLKASVTYDNEASRN